MQNRVEGGFVVLVDQFIIELHMPNPLLGPCIKFSRLDTCN